MFREVSGHFGECLRVFLKQFSLFWKCFLDPFVSHISAEEYAAVPGRLLVQMSLDVKKAEILKLDEKARMKEEALRKSQQMLGEDVDRFDRSARGGAACAWKRF